MIVLIDDERSFRSHVAVDDLLVFRHSGEALNWLAQVQDVEVDQLWLDHDLGSMNETTDSVMPVVKELVNMVRNHTAPKIHQVVVHTANPIGAQNIVGYLSPYFPVVRVRANDYLTVT